MSAPTSSQTNVADSSSFYCHCLSEIKLRWVLILVYKLTTLTVCRLAIIPTPHGVCKQHWLKPAPICSIYSDAMPSGGGASRVPGACYSPSCWCYRMMFAITWRRLQPAAADAVGRLCPCSLVSWSGKCVEQETRPVEALPRQLVQIRSRLCTYSAFADPDNDIIIYRTSRFAPCRLDAGDIMGRWSWVM